MSIMIINELIQIGALKMYSSIGGNRSAILKTTDSPGIKENFMLVLLYYKL